MAYTEIRKTLSKKDSVCKGCKNPIKSGSECVVNPKTKEIWCGKCGKGKI